MLFSFVIDVNDSEKFSCTVQDILQAEEALTVQDSFEVIIADPSDICSQPEIHDYIQKMACGVKIIGASVQERWNEIIKLIEGEYVLFFENETVYLEDIIHSWERYVFDSRFLERLGIFVGRRAAAYHVGAVIHKNYLPSDWMNLKIRELQYESEDGEDGVLQKKCSFSAKMVEKILNRKPEALEMYQEFLMQLHSICRLHPEMLTGGIRQHFMLMGCILVQTAGAVTEEKSEALGNVLDCIEDWDVLENKQLMKSQKLYLLTRKHPCAEEKLDIPENQIYYVNGIKIGDIAHDFTSVQFMRFEKGALYIEGVMKVLYATQPFQVFVSVNGEKRECNYLFDAIAEQCMGDVVNLSIPFSYTLYLDKNCSEYEISFYCLLDGVWVRKKQINFGKFAPLTEDIKASYYGRDGWVVQYQKKSASLLLCSVSEKEEKQYEKAFCREIFHKGIAGKKAVLVRWLARFQKKHQKKDIWLISDRINRADDNGEAFFRYVSALPEVASKRDIYFVIDRHTPEYRRLKKVGKVVSSLSWKHKFKHLLSTYVISSQGNEPVVMPFRKKTMFYKDILNDLHFVFLQHGITKDDQSAWLKRYNRNIYGLVVSTDQEYASMFQYPYYYEPSRIWKTGMPRFDLLYHDEKKYITIMPTWRKSLMKGTDPKTAIWLLKDGFQESAYFQFYNALLNHERLISEAGERGYTICFMPHPNIAPYANQFDKHEGVIYFDETKSYREIFAQSDLLVTDYSSVAFDFAYLKKPIVYTQFDREEFFSGSHSYTEGYFDYDRDGFGEVELDLERVVDRLIEYMENGCQLKEQYLERIQRGFSYHDQKCSERVLERLMKQNS